jgi:hypothetical protein
MWNLLPWLGNKNGRALSVCKKLWEFGLSKYMVKDFQVSFIAVKVANRVM